MMSQETSAQIIYDKAFCLVLDARRWPHTKQAAHRYICLAIRWAMARNLHALTEKLSGFSLQLGKSMDSVNSLKAVELCKELIEFAFLAGPTCEDCPARRFCENEQEYDRLDSLERPEDDCKLTALRWLAHELKEDGNG